MNATNLIKKDEPKAAIFANPIVNASSQTFQQLSFADIKSIGETFALSGYFADTQEAAKAIVKIMAGQEIGIPPYAAMSGINIVHGKPDIGASLMAGLIKNSNRYDFRIIEHTDLICEIEFYEYSQLRGKHSYSMNDAKRAGLIFKDTWKKYPKNMLFARCISDGAKWYCAGIFLGGIYSEGDDFGESIACSQPINVTPSVEESQSKSELEPETDWRIELNERFSQLKTTAAQNGYTKNGWDMMMGELIPTFLGAYKLNEQEIATDAINDMELALYEAMHKSTDEEADHV